MCECKECYSADNRATPLLNKEDCLRNHTQYICGTCGRCICIAKDDKRGLQRWNFPFKSLDIAKLYLRTADVTTRTSCRIYEIVNDKGRKSYKIFQSKTDVEEYLQKHKDRSSTGKPLYQKDEFKDFEGTQIRMLNEEEIKEYLNSSKE